MKEQYKILIKQFATDFTYEFILAEISFVRNNQIFMFKIVSFMLILPQILNITVHTCVYIFRTKAEIFLDNFSDCSDS